MIERQVGQRTKIVPSGRGDARETGRQLTLDGQRIASAHPARVAVRGLLVTTRPRQWTKNLLVFAAPFAAGLLGRPRIAERTLAAAFLFLLASAGTYLINDVIDVSADRLHPRKRQRPIAAGELSSTIAVAVGSGLLAAAVAGAIVVAGTQLAAVLAAYVTTSLVYSLWLKHVAVIELACVASGFVFRAIAGGVAVHVPISPWFAIVTSATALLVVAGKRSSEIDSLGEASPLHRKVLHEYPTTYLRSVRTIVAAVAIVGYCLWAFERAAHIDIGHADADNVLFELSIIPFVLGMMSVELAIETGSGGAPEELILGNRLIQVCGVVCLALVAVGIYT